jgi:beta-galactosidase/beta-glucuronidase
MAFKICCMHMRSVLITAFAVCSFGETIPRPEYPQPQFQRSEWQSLNGTWDFDFDNHNTGLDEQWATSGKKFSRTITVPFAPETKLSGIGDTAFHPQVWYRRTFTVKPEWKGRRLLLRFGAVDYRAMVWNVPFTFDITGVVKAGPNTITVRAEDPPTDRYIPRGKQYWEPKSKGIFYTRTTGIWQSVWLEATGASYLDSVLIKANAEGFVRFQALVTRPQNNLEFRAIVRRGKEQVATSAAAVKDGRAFAAAGVRDPHTWTPANPALYEVTFEVRRGNEVLDRVESYFGFRSVAQQGGRIILNGRPIYVKMILDQGYWPDSTITPPSDEAIQYDIRMTKEMGFNGARKHQKLEDPRFLYWADKMGLLVSSEMANAYLFDEQYAARFTREWMEAVNRDFNHPSIIMWVPINESWGVPDLQDSRQQNHLKGLYTLTRTLDDTRPVIDNDGWEHTDHTDLFAIHDYAKTGALLYAKYKDLGKPGLPIPNISRPSQAPGYKYNGTPILLSEFGGIAYIPPGTKVSDDAWGYSGVEKTESAALDRLRGIYEAIAKVPAFAGICYTQLTDVEQEINGLLTYDRKPKFDNKKLKEINDLLR